MICLSGSSINQIFYGILESSKEWPKEERRDGKMTIDSPSPVVIELTNPRHRVLSVVGRYNSLPSQCSETLWVLAGRDDIGWLSKYLPRAKDFSDDGKTWRAAYGPRLRGSGGVGTIFNKAFRSDQLAYVVNELRRSPDSRRAIISLHEPANDNTVLHKTGTLDFPCTGYLSFMPRGDRLDLLVTIRSNDLIWGWSGINVFEFTVLHELVAVLTGKRLGVYTQVSNSLHIYSDFENRVGNMIAAMDYDRLDVYDTYPSSRMASWPVPVVSLDYWLGQFFGTEELVSTGKAEIRAARDWDFEMPSFIQDLCLVVLIAAGVCGRVDVTEALACMNDPAMRLGVIEWLNRVHKLRLPAPHTCPENMRRWIEHG